jgi:O-antigen/teichoic acid export membrane protein
MDIRATAVRLLKATEKYTRTDMTYLARAGFWLNMSTIVTSFGGLLLYVVFGHYASKEVYGTYQYLLSFSAIVASFTLTGMNAAVTRSVARGQEGVLVRSVHVQLLWGALIFVLAGVCGCYYLLHGNATLGWGLVLCGIFVPINNALNTYGSFLSGKKDFRRGFSLALWYQIPYYASVALIAFLSGHALLLFTANLVSQCIGLFIAYRVTLAVYKPNDVQDPEVLRYGAHLSAIGLLGSVVSQMDSILTFHFLGATDLALYSFSTAIPDRIGSLFKFLPMAAFPKFAGRAPRDIRVGLARRLFLGTLVALVLAGLYALIAHFIFALLFPAYLEAVGYSQWYALSLGGVLTGVVVNALTAAGNVRALYGYNIASPLVTLGLEFGGILVYGLDGLIGARIIGSIFSLTLAMFLYWRIK